MYVGKFVTINFPTIFLGITRAYSSRRTRSQAERPFCVGPSAESGFQADDPEGGHHQEDQERRRQEHEGHRQVDQRHLGSSPVKTSTDCSLH
jgi:hypothetical protein